jgi:hypothetical protein
MTISKNTSSILVELTSKNKSGEVGERSTRRGVLLVLTHLVAMFALYTLQTVVDDVAKT